MTSPGHDHEEPAEPGTRPELTGQASSFGFPGAASADGPHPDLAAGTLVGDCRIERRIGRGGMGSVYEAWQGNPQRLVAVKILHGGGVSADAVVRFEHEAAALARLRHPGIAHVYTAGVAAGPAGGLPSAGLPFLVMELVPNARSITAHAAAESLPLRQRIELFVGVCEAAAHAHRQGLVHRDIKPGNILVEPGGATKLIDFGIALEAGRDGAAGGPAAGERPLRHAGTPQYMSPEQFHESWGDPGPRSDVYSLGLVLYELVAGCRPYDVDSTKITEAARVVAVVEPRPLPPTVDRPLARVIGKCLAKPPALRYADAAALAADLRRYLNGDEVLAGPEPLWEAVLRLGRRHRPAMTAAVVAVAALATAAVGISAFALRARRAEAEARHEAARARDESRTAQQLADSNESRLELEKGRVRTAYALACRAYESRPAWEHGRQIAAVVDAARGGWQLVDRMAFDERPAWLAFPRGRGDALVLGFADRVEFRRVGGGPAATAALAGTTLPCPVAADALAVAVPADGIRVLSLPGLIVTATCRMPGDVTTLRACGDGSRLAALNAAGLATVFETGGRQVASRQFAVKRGPGRPGLAVSPGGGRLAWHSGVWSEPKLRWDVETDEVHPFALPVHDLAFESESTVVGVWSPAALGERIRLLRHDVDRDEPADGTPLGAIGVRYRQGASVECLVDQASGEATTVLVAPDAVSGVWLPRLARQPSPRPLILMPLPDDGYGYSRVQAVLGEALWPHVTTPVAIGACDPATLALALTAGDDVLVFAAVPGRLAGRSEAPASSLTSRACGTDYWSFHADGREALACAGSDLHVVSLETGARKTVALEQPTPAPGRGVVPWGVTATPDGGTVAVLWQEHVGGGHIGSEFHRKIAAVYRLDGDRRRATLEASFPLACFAGVNGRLNREFVITPDGETIAFCAANGTVVGYRVADGSERYTFAAGTTFAAHAATGRFADGRADRAGGFHVHDLRDGSRIASWQLAAPVTRAQFAPDGATIYIGLTSGTLARHDARDGRLVSELRSALAPFAISHGGDRFVGRAEDNVAAPAGAGWTPGSLVVADLATGRSVAALAPTAHVLNRAAFGADDRWIASVTERTVVRFAAAVDPRRAAELLEQESAAEAGEP